MPKLFEEDLEEDVNIKTDNEYAKNYDNWRKKEELNKRKYQFIIWSFNYHIHNCNNLL